MNTNPYPQLSYGPICMLIPAGATEVSIDETPGCRVEISSNAWNQIVTHRRQGNLAFSVAVSECGRTIPVVVLAIAAPGSVSLIAFDPTDPPTRVLMERNDALCAMAITFTPASDVRQSLPLHARHDFLFARHLAEAEFLAPADEGLFAKEAAAVLTGCHLRCALDAEQLGMQVEIFSQICVPAEF